MTISPRHVWLTGSKMIVRDPGDPVYVAQGYPAPKRGMVFRNANITTETLRNGRLFTSDTAETAVAMMEYGLYTHAAPAIQALTETTYLRTVWGQQIRFVSEAWFPEGGSYVMQQWESHTRTACLVAYALAKWANHDNTPIGGITPRQWAIDVLFSVRRTQMVSADRIAEGEQPAWTAGAMYENWNSDPSTATATPSWSMLSAFNQDALELAVAQLLPHGAAVTTSQGASYNLQTMRDNYRTFIQTCHGRTGYLMPCGLPHQRVRLDGAGGGEFVNWYTPGTTPPNPIGNNATWTTDAMGWIIRGRALAGSPIAPLLTAFKALLLATPHTWYDAFNADGTRATDGEESEFVTQALSIVFLATREASDVEEDASLLPYVTATQLDYPGSDWGHGAWTWTGDTLDHIEAVATALNLMAVKTVTQPPDTDPDPDPGTDPGTDPFPEETLRQINAARDQTHANLALSQGHVDLAQAASGSANAAATRAESAVQRTVTVDMSVGTRVFAGDVMIFGDTGWRRVDDLANGYTFDADPSPGLWLRRVNETVYLSMRGYVDRSKGDGSPSHVTREVPFGFRHAGPYSTNYHLVHGQMLNLQTTATLQLTTTQMGGTRLSVQGMTVTNFPDGARAFIMAQWQTSNLWPTTLPGTPA